MSKIPIQQALQTAVQHHEANRLDQAESIYRQVLASQPDHPVAQYFLARVMAQRGRLDEAVELLRKNVQRNPHVAEPQIALGEYLRMTGQLEESISTLLRAANIAPSNADLFNALGNSLGEVGRTKEAITAFERAIEIKPDFAEPYSNLGNALRRLGQFDESIAAHRQAVRLKPQSPEVHNNFGLALKEKGDLDEAISVFSRAIELRGDYIEALNNLGTALVARGRLDDALANFVKAANLGPDRPDVQNNLGNILKEKGRLDESAAAFARAIQLRPDFAEAHSNLGINLSSQGRLDEAIAAFRRAAQLRPDVAQYFGNVLYTLHFHPNYDAQTILREHVEWARRHADPLSATIAPHLHDRSPDRRLKIGYASPDFRDHPVGRFVVPLLEHHDHEHYEIFCYSGVKAPDELTARIRGYADQWRNIVSLSDEAAADQVRRDRIDILIDLTLHMAGGRLLMFARKPAPVQVTWLGYVGTTGLKAIDYRISDPYLDPPHLSEAYVEQTIRTPHCYWCYAPPATTPPVNPLPALTSGHVTFGCFNNFSKVAEPTLELWAKILAAVPKSRLLIHSHAGAHVESVRKFFQSKGVEEDRLEFIPMMPISRYLREHHRVDIALDPFPYAGGTTTCDALWMGVAVVTLAGQTAVGRAGVSLLSNVGLTEFIASSREQYLAIATAFAGDLPKLAELRATLRERMSQSTLMDAKRFAKDMESTYRQIWKNWCGNA